LLEFSRTASACEDHPTVQGGGTAPTAPAGLYAYGISYALDGVAETDLPIADETGKPHAIRFVFASVLRVAPFLLH
jgi:hypothetical protein